MGHFTPLSDLWLHHCVEVLECEQPTLEENLPGKYKGDKTVYIHVDLRMPVFPKSSKV